MTNLEPDPLEQLLDEQSDSEFGLPEFKEQKQVLGNWSAQDFSDIYVRFYPHLLRHAKRYLTNYAQAEEVVQDAFLYLMTSLPEIDSEIGVLKLLKWKVRNLALDVISANGKASFAPVDDVDLPVEHELSENLIRADEASIVSLALAKLNPRQREALIASLYEEKETVQIANQMGLSENATRQLLFRAKSAFKKALVGEAETAGMSVSQILSIAARKAAKESGKYVSAASAFLLLLAVSFGVLPNLPRQAETQVSAPVAEVEKPTLRLDDESNSPATVDADSPGNFRQEGQSGQPMEIVKPTSQPTPMRSGEDPMNGSLTTFAATERSLASQKEIPLAIAEFIEERAQITIDNTSGLKAVLSLGDPKAKDPVTQVSLVLRIGNQNEVFVPTTFASQWIQDEEFRTLYFIGTDLLTQSLINPAAETLVRTSAIRVRVTFDELRIINSQIFLVTPTS